MLIQNEILYYVLTHIIFGFMENERGVHVSSIFSETYVLNVYLQVTRTETVDIVYL